MTTFGPQNTATFAGGTSNDTFVVDPNNLGLNRITDDGGLADVLEIYDRPGRTSGEFAVEGSLLVWRPFSGPGVVEIEMTGGLSPVEFVRRTVLEEDGDPGSLTMRVITDLEAITGRNFIVAGTQDDDAMGAPLFATRQRGLSEMYGNGGNDIMFASNRHKVLIYGGDGNDTIRGVGGQADDMLGDDGNDRLFGNGGNDILNGGDGRDTIAGDSGRDQIIGGLGNDLLRGGSGADNFRFVESEGNEGRDVIRGFVIGTDKIIMDGYAPGDNVLSILPINGDRDTGDSLVTLVETGTQIALIGISVNELLPNAGSIFEIV